MLYEIKWPLFVLQSLIYNKVSVPKAVGARFEFNSLLFEICYKDCFSEQDQNAKIALGPEPNPRVAAKDDH